MFQNWLWREAYKSSMMNESIILFKKINSEPQVSPTKLQTVRRISRRTRITRRPKSRAKWMRASWAIRRLVFFYLKISSHFLPGKRGWIVWWWEIFESRAWKERTRTESFQTRSAQKSAVRQGGQQKTRDSGQTSTLIPAWVSPIFKLITWIR